MAASSIIAHGRHRSDGEGVVGSQKNLITR